MKLFSLRMAHWVIEQINFKVQCLLVQVCFSSSKKTRYICETPWLWKYRPLLGHRVKVTWLSSLMSSECLTTRTNDQCFIFPHKMVTLTFVSQGHKMVLMGVYCSFQCGLKKLVYSDYSQACVSSHLC